MLRVDLLLAVLPIMGCGMLGIFLVTGGIIGILLGHGVSAFIESQLHWCLDVVFREDASRARKDNSPLNMNILRKTAMTCLNETKYGRLSKKKKMFKAALNPEVMLNILFQRKK